MPARGVLDRMLDGGTDTNIAGRGNYDPYTVAWHRAPDGPARRRDAVRARGSGHDRPTAFVRPMPARSPRED